ncbi:MAG: hypothetical protein MUE36_02295 [Acidimicrobiales bacterium]|jgi:hypothetical protein|nr:hypothetical protein [Acidimicrobiales bacterium]
MEHTSAKLDECSRRVKNETLGHRGRKADLLHRCRRLLLAVQDRLDSLGEAKLAGPLCARDPPGQGQ